MHINKQYIGPLVFTVTHTIGPVNLLLRQAYPDLLAGSACNQYQNFEKIQVEKTGFKIFF